VKRGFFRADRELWEENTVSPLRQRSTAEQAQAYLRHQKIILTETGVSLADEAAMTPKILKRLQQLSEGMRFAVFGDVLLTLKTLKAKKLKVGLLTNLDRDMSLLSRELGLQEYLDFVVTSAEAGADKPAPPIFEMALQRADVRASEAVHVGDQYKLDVLGARGVGIVPILIDRDDFYPEVTDCRRIHSLTEVIDLLPIL
ncbi:MAG: HAD-IA family hydrolase, partial [Chloroflexota bacterium]